MSIKVAVKTFVKLSFFLKRQDQKDFFINLKTSALDEAIVDDVDS